MPCPGERLREGRQGSKGMGEDRDGSKGSERGGGSLCGGWMMELGLLPPSNPRPTFLECLATRLIYHLQSQTSFPQGGGWRLVGRLPWAWKVSPSPTTVPSLPASMLGCCCFHLHLEPLSLGPLPSVSQFNPHLPSSWLCLVALRTPLRFHATSCLGQPRIPAQIPNGVLLGLDFRKLTPGHLTLADAEMCAEPTCPDGHQAWSPSTLHLLPTTSLPPRLTLQTQASLRSTASIHLSGYEGAC